MYSSSYIASYGVQYIIAIIIAAVLAWYTLLLQLTLVYYSMHTRGEFRIIFQQYYLPIRVLYGGGFIFLSFLCVFCLFCVFIRAGLAGRSWLDVSPPPPHTIGAAAATGRLLCRANV